MNLNYRQQTYFYQYLTQFSLFQKSQVLLLVALTLSAAAAAPQNVVLRAVPLGSVPAPLTHVAHTPIAHPLTHVAHAVAPAPTVVRTVAPAPVVETVEVEADPSYQFGYQVTDTKTGDSKSREEVRDGDVVTGSYTVADPDGRIRHVTYTADAVNGFNAVVTYDGEAGPPAIPFNAPAPAAVATAVATPVAAEATPVVTEVRDGRQLFAAPTVVRTTPVASHVVHAAPFASHVVNPAAGAVHAVHHATPTATLVRNVDGTLSHAVHHAATPTATIVRNTDGTLSHAVHHAATPTTTFLRNADGSLTPVSALPINAPFLQSSALNLFNSGAFFIPQQAAAAPRAEAEDDN